MENIRKINDGRSLSKAIQAIIQESVEEELAKNAQQERQRQTNQSSKPLDEEDETKSSADDESSKSSKTMDDEKSKLKKGDITAEDVIEKLNSIRSGKSFKDEGVKNKLSEYVESLSKAEKTALFAFLKGISQLVTGEFEPAAAVEPSDKDPGVAMKKKGEAQKVTVKANVIKKVPETDKSKKKSAEDTSGPVPIAPKK
jgi:hypothetical protein